MYKEAGLALLAGTGMQDYFLGAGYFAFIASTKA